MGIQWNPVDGGGLREIIPGYQDALDTSGDYLSQQQSYNNAKGLLFNTKKQPQDFTSLMGDSDPQDAAVKAAVGNDLYMRAQAGQLRAGDLARPDVNAKLSAVFGPDQATSLAGLSTDESAMLPAERLIPAPNGSQTFALGDGNADQSGINPGQIAADAGTGIIMGRPPVHATLGAIFKNIAGTATPTGMSIQSMAVPVRDELGRVLLGSPSDASDYLSAFQPNTTPTPPAYGLFGGGLDAFLNGNGFNN